MFDKINYPTIHLIYQNFTACVTLVSDFQEITVDFLGNILFGHREYVYKVRYIYIKYNHTNTLL